MGWKVPPGRGSTPSLWKLVLDWSVHPGLSGSGRYEDGLLCWGLLLGSSLSFIFVTVYMFRQPGQEKGWIVPLFETGIAMSLLALALFVAAQLTLRDWRRA